MVFDEVELANGEVLYSPKRGNCNAKKGEGLSDGGYCFNKVRYQLALKTFRESREGDLEFLRNNTEYKKALAEEDKNSGKRKFDERVSSTDRRAYRQARGAFLKTTTKRLKEDSNPSGITIQRDGNPQAFKEILRPSANKKKKNQREYDEAAAQADERAYQRYRQNASSGMAVYPKDEDLGKWGEAVRKTFTPAPQPQSDPAIP